MDGLGSKDIVLRWLCLFHESFAVVGDVMFCALSLKVDDSFWVHVHSFVCGFGMERFHNYLFEDE